METLLLRQRSWRGGASALARARGESLSAADSIHHIEHHDDPGAVATGAGRKGSENVAECGTVARLPGACQGAADDDGSDEVRPRPPIAKVTVGPARLGRRCAPSIGGLAPQRGTELGRWAGSALLEDVVDRLSSTSSAFRLDHLSQAGLGDHEVSPPPQIVP